MEANRKSADNGWTFDRVRPPWPLPGGESGDGVWGRRILVAPGEHVLIAGPSGSGKSTLLSLLLGREGPGAGTILLNGAPMPRHDFPALASLRASTLSAVLQDFHLAPGLDGYGNAGLLPVRLPDWRQRLEADADVLGIRDLLGRPVATWSYGQRQRLALLRALLRPARWFLLDEPFSHLDGENRGRALSLLLKRAADAGAGIILCDLREVPGFTPNLVFSL